jgi:hypothetical protein
MNGASKIAISIRRTKLAISTIAYSLRASFRTFFWSSVFLEKRESFVKKVS